VSWYSAVKPVKNETAIKKLTKILTQVTEILFIALHVSNYNLPYNSQHSWNARSIWSDRSSSSVAVKRPELTQYDIQVCWSCYQMTVPLQPGEGRWHALHIPMGNPYNADASLLQKNVLDTHTYYILEYETHPQSDANWRDRRCVSIRITLINLH
jgi:hypothetical protein